MKNEAVSQADGFNELLSNPVLENVLNASRDLLGVLNADGRFIWVNRALAAAAGREPQDCIGEHGYDLFQTDLLKSAILSGSGSGVFRFSAEPGPLKKFEYTLTSSEDRGALAGVLVFSARDISEVESLQEALNAATGREKYVCTKHEALLSKFSFEFRTALTGIIGMVQFLMDTPLNDDQAEYTETLDQCSVQLLDLVDGLLASKNDSKKIEEYPELAREVSAAVIQGSSGPDAASAGLSGIRILLAEDNELNAKVAKKMLLEAGALVDVAANGQIAVEHMLKSHYDLVLMDCEMPVMSGWDAVRHIRKAGCVSTPVIALTAHTVGEAWAQCADAGMTGILSKPFHEKQLYQAIREAVAKNNGVGT